MTDPRPLAIGRTCHRCAGTGLVPVRHLGKQLDVSCHICGGSGQQPAERGDCCGADDPSNKNVPDVEPFHKGD